MPASTPLRKWSVLFGCMLLLWLSSLHRAQAQAPNEEAIGELGDYDIHHTGWNGLSTLSALAQGSGLQVLQENFIQWEELDSDDIVFLLYPTNIVDPSLMVTFIRNGGRVLIADDYGQGALLLSHLGGRLSEDISPTTYYENKVFAPIATPTGPHPLSQGVKRLTTNHPAALQNLEGMDSIFSLGDHSTLVAAGTIGAGRYVALSDPSILINRMLQFEGNLQFSINLIHFLTREGQSDRLIVLSGDVIFDGIPRNQYDDGTLRGAASMFATKVDGWLDQLNTWALSSWGLKMVTLLCAFGLAIGAFLSIPKKRRRPLDGSWTQAETPETHIDKTELVARYESIGARSSFLLPAAIARDNINSALEQVLESPDPLYSMEEDELIKSLKASGHAQTASLVKALLPRLRNIPQRAQAAAHWQPRFLGRKEFEAIHQQSLALFEQLQFFEKNKPKSQASSPQGR